MGDTVLAVAGVGTPILAFFTIVWSQGLGPDLFGLVAALSVAMAATCPFWVLQEVHRRGYKLFESPPAKEGSE